MYVVQCKTQESYDKLMNAYKDKEWNIIGWKEPNSFNMFELLKEKTCVFFKDWFKFADIDYCKSNKYNIITEDEAIWILNEEFYT